jgi:hypothetical protein
MPAPAALVPADLQTTYVNQTNFPASDLFTVSTITDASKNVALVIPFLAELDGTSTANMAVLQSQTTSQDVHALFKVVLTEAESVKLLNSFSLQEANTMPAFDSDNSNSNIDPSFNVLLSNQDDFAAVLAAAMHRALVVPGCGDEDPDISGGRGAKFGVGSTVYAQDVSNSAAAYMREKMRLYLNQQLASSGLASIIAAANMKSVEVMLDACGGAVDMGSRIADGEAALRRLLLTQIPKDTLEHYITSRFNIADANGAVAPAFLPMKGADELTFVFVTKVTDPDMVTIDGGDVVGTQGASTQAAGGFVTPYLNGQIVRRIGFVLQLGELNSYFKRNIGSDVTNAAAHLTTYAGSVLGERIYDLSQSMIDASSAPVPYAARLPYTLATSWSSTDAADITSALAAINKDTAGSPAKALYDLSEGATAVRDAVANRTGLYLSADFLAIPGAPVAIDNYNKALWKYVLLQAKDVYEKARAGDYAAGSTKSWDNTLNGSLADKPKSSTDATQATSNGM